MPYGVKSHPVKLLLIQLVPQYNMPVKMQLVADIRTLPYDTREGIYGDGREI